MKVKIEDLHKKYEAYLPFLFFISGFLFDVFTLGEVDNVSNIVSLGLYLVIAGVILWLELIKYDGSKVVRKPVKLFFEYRDDIFHFFLGALLSAFTLFYFKSASFSNSFLFMFAMAGVLIFNEIEFFKKRGIVVRAILFKLCLLSYFLYVIPVVAGSSGIWFFILGLFLSIITVVLLSWRAIRRGECANNTIKYFLAPQLAVGLVFSLLYMTRTIPPIPLSLKHIGVYRDVIKENGNYITAQTTPKWKFWLSGDQNFTYQEGDRVFVFTKIFSPAGYEGKTFLVWEKLIGGDYKTSDRIPLAITGGRREGYRGYAYKENYTSGQWRVRVETASGLEIGRIYFRVLKSEGQSSRELIYTTMK